MSLTVSPVIKVFALLGLLAAVALAGAFMFLGRPPAEADAAPIVLPKKKVGLLETPAAAKTVAKKANAAAKKTAASTKTPAASPPAAKKAAVAPAKAEGKAKKPAAKKLAAPAAPAAPAAKKEPLYQGVATNGLPMQIAVALQRQDVVVVSIWGTGGKIDEMARDEAAAGAAAAGAGFVALNVIERSREAEALTLKLGVILRTPGVLYFTKPDLLANRLDGFRDRETVAQGALNALR